MNHKKELLRSLWVVRVIGSGFGISDQYVRGLKQTWVQGVTIGILLFPECPNIGA